jgi:hypothetical protein
MVNLTREAQGLFGMCFAPEDGVTKLLMRSLGISGYRKIERAFAPTKGRAAPLKGAQEDWTKNL